MGKFKFSEKSEQRLVTCTFKIQVVLTEGLAWGLMDFGIACGFRNEERQEKAYPKYSNVEWPFSEHNKLLSPAVDVFPWLNNHAPWEEDDPDYWAWDYLAGILQGAGKKLDMPLRWGRDFPKLKDLGHFEEV